MSIVDEFNCARDEHEWVSVPWSVAERECRICHRVEKMRAPLRGGRMFCAD